MAQKTNPISLKLGKYQVWDSISQNYGKTYIYYSKVLHNHLQFLIYLNRIFFYNFVLSYTEWFILKQKVYLNIYYSDTTFSESLQFFKMQKEIQKVIPKFLLLKSCVRFYLRISISSISMFLMFYTQYLLKKDIALLKIMNSMYKILNSCLNLVKVSYSKNGPIRIKLIGFKIRLAGRFDNSRNQMAKVSKLSLGQLSLTSLNYYMEYSKKDIFTKFGTCGLQIWLFYEKC
uniref:Ribosomal protein S3 n=1 Tax=Asparagopsis taxiformis TaxID=260499 RepID=A0A0E3DBI5_9FLOR|nr:ribosomal protein S3 [Asparagopsis taxiformis]AHX02396.1 ribosomal protein S3 [Asparagopsis taxiformis]